MARQVQVGAGVNGADRHRPSPAGEGHAAAPSQKSLVREEQPEIRAFSVKSSNLPMCEGKWTYEDVTAILLALERHFTNEAQAIGWVGTTGWGEQAVLQLKCDAAVSGMHCSTMSAPIEWSTFCTKLKAKFISSNAFDLVKQEWEELSRKNGERVT